MNCVEIFRNCLDKGPAKSRAEVIAERARQRANAAADEAMGPSTGSGGHSRYDRERAAAGLSNGQSSTAAAPASQQSSVDVARLLDEIKKLTLVVKAHEARIKQLESLVVPSSGDSGVITTEKNNNNEELASSADAN